MQTNLQNKVINPQYNGSQIHTENIQSKKTSIWQEKNMEQREERTGEEAMRNESIMRENNRKTMRNNSVPFYFS